VTRKHRGKKAPIHRKPSTPLDTTMKAVTDMVALTGTLTIGTLAINKLSEMAKK